MQYGSAVAESRKTKAYVERYYRTVRYGWLARYPFGMHGEIQQFATRGVWTYYNHYRPIMILGASRIPLLLSRAV